MTKEEFKFKKELERLLYLYYNHTEGIKKEKRADWFSRQYQQWRKGMSDITKERSKDETSR